MLKNIFFGILVISCLAGCASVKETAKGFLGISTKVLEDTRPDAMKENFKLSAEEAFAKSKVLLKERAVYIYAQDPKELMIAVYVSEQDTTPVGVFFEKITESETMIEVSSPSIYAKELIATKLFSALKEYSTKVE